MAPKKNNIVWSSAVVLALAFSFSADAGKKIVVPFDFRTIHMALGEADAGDTVFVSRGIYKENIALVENVVLLGQDMLTTQIDGTRSGPCVIGADNATIENFTIINGSTGILCKNTRPIIQRNLIVDNKGAGIHVLVSLPDINNNIIYRNEWTGIFLEGVRGTRTSVSHNVILENGYSGIFCAHKTEVLLRNNIVMDNAQHGIYIGPEATKTRLVFNDIYGNRRPFNISTRSVNASNFGKDPIFISPDHPEYNYYIKTISPCRGTGENHTDIGLVNKQAVEIMSKDRDGDGILDEVDQCPDVPEDMDGFQDQDGCPDYDNDNDGIYDTKDNCPAEPEDMDGFGDEDGCPDTDNDQDGICDPWVAQQGKSSQFANVCRLADQCPNNPETVNGYKDDDGCPDEKPVEIRQTFILQGVNFKTASAELLEESYPVLEQVFNSLEAYPAIKIEVGGHTDNQGKSEYNRRLSYDRAKSVMNFLVMRGISANRIVAKGYGKDKPIASNATPDGMAVNRRVEIVPLK